MNKPKIEKVLECTTTETKYWLAYNCDIKLPLLTSLILFSYIIHQFELQNLEF